jgi:hypothetical protein
MLGAMTDRPSDRTGDLRVAIEKSGYYPDVVSDAVNAAVAHEEVVSYLVHHEPTIDERDEVRRHVTVLVLTPTRLILAHTDEHAPDDLLPAPGANEAVLTIGWGSVGRVDLEPAGCADPDCEADHGYTGLVTSDDFSLRVSAAAEGPEAVANLLGFADALSAHTAR